MSSSWLRLNPGIDPLTSICGDIDKSPWRKALIFFHGYNVAFEEAARRTAQIVYDLGFVGTRFSTAGRRKVARTAVRSKPTQMVHTSLS